MYDLRSLHPEIDMIMYFDQRKVDTFHQEPVTTNGGFSKQKKTFMALFRRGANDRSTYFICRRIEVWTTCMVFSACIVHGYIDSSFILNVLYFQIFLDVMLVLGVNYTTILIRGKVYLVLQPLTQCERDFDP